VQQETKSGQRRTVEWVERKRNPNSAFVAISKLNQGLSPRFRVLTAGEMAPVATSQATN
jgi:hypothetical protein